MRILFTFIVFYLLPILSFSQDSVEETVRAYNYQSLEFKKSNFDSSIYYAQKAYHLADENNLLILRDSSTICLIQGYLFSGNRETGDSLLSTIGASIENDEKFHAKIAYYKLLGFSYTSKGDFRLAIECFQNGIKLMDETNYDLLIADFLVDIAVNQTSIGKLVEAQENYNEAMNYALQNDDRDLQQYILINSGVLAKDLKQYEKALELYEQALTLTQQSNDSVMMGDVYANIAVVYYDQGDQISSLKYNRKVKYIREQTNDLGIYYAINLNNIGLNFLKLHSLDSASYYFDRTLLLCVEIEDNYGIADVKINMACLAIEQKKFSLAEELISEGLDLGESIDAIELLVDSYEELATYFAESGHYQRAYEFHRKYQVLNDSIYGIENQKQISELNILYATELKQNEILRLSNEGIEAKANETIAKTTAWISISAAIALLFIGIFFWNRKRTRHALDNIQTAIDSSEKEKVRIGKELHDTVASELIYLFYETETDQPVLSNKLLLAYNDVRKLSHQLNNFTGKNQMLTDQLSDLVPDAYQHCFTLNISPHDLHLEEPINTHFYRIIQELVTNSLKHSNATKIVLSVTKEDQKISVHFYDNGDGVKEFNKAGGHSSIADRLKLMKGSITVTSSVNEGFDVGLTIPLLP
ncbi:MAG: tetratricopeptide repeat protein [Crocinitomicaceae bacterium]|nr:tetratricopeptide repeat protein [Crocinitomicaceae bacterium]